MRRFLNNFNLHPTKANLYFRAILCQLSILCAQWKAMLKDMNSYNHLKPGQKGTRRLVEKYGESLLCVRYRYDAKRGVRLQTVEIIVEEKPDISPRFNDSDIVPVFSML